MPKANIVIYQENDGRVPLIEWLDDIPQKAQDKCIVKIEMLMEYGYELRRPHCDLLEDGIYELRARPGPCQLPYIVFFSWEKSGAAFARLHQRERVSQDGNQQGCKKP
jgi:hypothetical protein